MLKEYQIKWNIMNIKIEIKIGNCVFHKKNKQLQD